VRAPAWRPHAGPTQHSAAAGGAHIQAPSIGTLHFNSHYARARARARAAARARAGAAARARARAAHLQLGIVLQVDLLQRAQRAQHARHGGEAVLLQADGLEVRQARQAGRQARIGQPVVGQVQDAQAAQALHHRRHARQLAPARAATPVGPRQGRPPGLCSSPRRCAAPRLRTPRARRAPVRACARTPTDAAGARDTACRPASLQPASAWGAHCAMLRHCRRASVDTPSAKPHAGASASPSSLSSRSSVSRLRSMLTTCAGQGRGRVGSGPWRGHLPGPAHRAPRPPTRRGLNDWGGLPCACKPAEQRPAGAGGRAPRAAP